MKSPGRRSRALVSGVDVFGTICDYAKAENSTNAESVRKIVEGNQDSLREYVYVENNYWGRAIVGSRYKLVFDYIPGHEFDYMPPRMRTHRVGDKQFFDLLTDPHETVDLSRTMTAEIEKMLQWTQNFEEELDSQYVHDSAKNLVERCQKRVCREYEKSKL